MISDDFGMSNRCPLCFEGELKFVHINLEEDVKICMNEQCVYPFEVGVVDEFRPSKSNIKEGCRGYESAAVLMNQIEEEYHKDCLEWDRFAEGNEFLTDMDQKTGCEFVDMMDGPSGDDVPNTCASEDSFISKLLQSHADADAGEPEANSNATDASSEDYLRSIISELEEAQEKDTEACKWDADDFNADTLEEKYTPVPDVTDHTYCIPDHTYSTLPAAVKHEETGVVEVPAPLVDMSTNAVAIKSEYGKLTVIDPSAMTLVVKCAENVPLHQHFGKYVKSVCVIRPPASGSDNVGVNQLFVRRGSILDKFDFPVLDKMQLKIPWREVPKAYVRVKAERRKTSVAVKREYF